MMLDASNESSSISNAIGGDYIYMEIFIFKVTWLRIGKHLYARENLNK